MPLAAGYLAAMVRSDPELSARSRIEIVNYPGATSPWEMATRLLSGAVPDVLAFLVLGWDVRQFGALAETFKQVNPKGTVVFGGNHVSNQAERASSPRAAPRTPTASPGSARPPPSAPVSPSWAAGPRALRKG